MTVPPSRTRMAAADRRRQLLDVARDIVDRRGFGAVSVEAIARTAGVTRPVVYGHFRDLDQLLEAMVAREGASALAQLREVLPAPGSGDVRSLLRATLRGYLDTVRRDPATWRLVLVPPEGAPAVLREHIRQGRAAVVAALAEVIGGAGGAGIPDPELTARLLSAVADEMARLVLADPDRYPVERLVAEAGWFLDRLQLGPEG